MDQGYIHHPLDRYIQERERSEMSAMHSSVIRESSKRIKIPHTPLYSRSGILEDMEYHNSVRTLKIQIFSNITE